MGVRLVYDGSRDILAAFEREVEAILEMGARATQEEAQRSIRTGSRSGRVYIRGGQAHQASAQGEAPANDTGTLADSIVIERPSKVRRRVVVGEPYGAILELRKGRPFLLPAFYASVPRMRAALRDLQRRGGWRSMRPLRRSIHYTSRTRGRKS